MESCIKMKKPSTHVYAVEENTNTCTWITKIVDFHKLLKINHDQSLDISQNITTCIQKH